MMKRLGCFFGLHEWSRWHTRDTEGIPLPSGWVSRHCYLCKTEKWKPLQAEDQAKPGPKTRDQAFKDQATGPAVDSDQDEPLGGHLGMGGGGGDDSDIFQEEDR